MCGIAGRINFEAPLDRAQLFALTARLAHRGPDDHGYHVRARVGLGHRRLAIIDLDGGHQPLANEEGTLWVVFNGELYNHVALRRELVECGHRFVTHSDTEVLVHGYEQWGDDLPRHLDGMYACALFDERQERLTLMRDPLGEKPLFYARLGRDLAFASELRALLALPELDRTLDDEALAAYLTLRYVPAPRALLRGVSKLSPGTSLVWSRGEVTLRTDWQLGHARPRIELQTTVAEAQQRLATLLDESVSSRLLSDVPVGLFLSGGLDSALVAEAAIRVQGAPLPTLSVGYSDPGTEADDERAAARQTAHALRAPHVETLVGGHEVQQHLDDILWSLDEPVADPAAVPLWFLARRARAEGLRVVLSGEGGDELLGGYALYARHLARDRLSSSPTGALVARGLGSLLRLAARLPLSYPQSARLRRAASLLVPSEVDQYLGVSRGLDLRWLGAHGRSARVATEVLLAPHRARSAGMSRLGRMLSLDTSVWLPDDLLAKADKMTMAHAVELRVPLLRPRLVDFCWSLPDHFKVRGGVGKWLLRQVAVHRLPEAVVRRKKRGFSTPTASWLRGPLWEVLADSLLSAKSLARSLLPLQTIDLLLEAHRRGQELTAELWPLLVLERWHARLQAQSPALEEVRDAAV
jgi:asparagine synthase (glutamine-hydrolysing)